MCFPPPPPLHTHPFPSLSGLRDASQVGPTLHPPCSRVLVFVPRAALSLAVTWWGSCGPLGQNASWVVSKAHAD